MGPEEEENEDITRHDVLPPSSVEVEPEAPPSNMQSEMTVATPEHHNTIEQEALQVVPMTCSTGSTSSCEQQSFCQPIVSLATCNNSPKPDTLQRCTLDITTALPKSNSTMTDSCKQVLSPLQDTVLGTSHSIGTQNHVESETNRSRTPAISGDSPLGKTVLGATHTNQGKILLNQTLMATNPQDYLNNTQMHVVEQTQASTQSLLGTVTPGDLDVKGMLNQTLMATNPQDYLNNTQMHDVEQVQAATQSLLGSVTPGDLDVNSNNHNVGEQSKPFIIQQPTYSSGVPHLMDPSKYGKGL